ncbi:MAG: hypothetical protein WDN28_10240 [Chthoniobacter sp.]
MAWSLDWFAAEKLAKAGAQIRRVAWTDKVLVRDGPLWFLVTGGVSTVIKATDFTSAEFNARDWTDQTVQRGSVRRRRRLQHGSD